VVEGNEASFGRGTVAGAGGGDWERLLLAARFTGLGEVSSGVTSVWTGI